MRKNGSRPNTAGRRRGPRGAALLLVTVGAWAVMLAMAATASAVLTPVGGWGSSGTGPGQFSDASGLTLSQGTAYVGDATLNRIQRFDLTGHLVGAWSLPFGPQQIAADATGTIYATAGAGNPYAVQAYSPTGTLVASWTGTGTPAGRMAPLGVGAANGRVYVADHTRVAVFTPAGGYITQFGSSGNGPGQFTDARKVALDAQGNVYVYDAGTPRVEKFDSSGNFITQFGTSNPNGSPSPSNTYGASAITVSPQGFLYVADFYYFRLQKFTLSGQLAAVYQCGTPDTGGVNCRPSGIGVATDGTLYMIDYNTRILEFKESSAPPPPVLGQSVDAKVIAGQVSVKAPGGAGFVPLASATQIPVGSQIDARAGTLQVTTATPKQNSTFAGDFGGAIFSIAQSKAQSQHGLTTLTLLEGAVKGGPSFTRCTAKKKKGARLAAASRRVLELLHASAHGNFRTRGRYSAATVRGTKWDTTDRCDGTLTVVHRGTVVVNDFRRHKNVIVHAGHRYLAKAR
jgi:sugar lactone lactonase YvrE